MKPKGVTTQMKALNEYILIAVFTSNSWTVKWNLKVSNSWTQMKVSQMKWVHSNSSVHFQLLNCQMKPKGVTTQMKALNEYILIAVFTSNSWTVKWNLKVWPLKWKLSMSTF